MVCISGVCLAFCVHVCLWLALGFMAIYGSSGASLKAELGLKHMHHHPQPPPQAAHRHRLPGSNPRVLRVPPPHEPGGDSVLPTPGSSFWPK